MGTPNKLGGITPKRLAIYIYIFTFGFGMGIVSMAEMASMYDIASMA